MHSKSTISYHEVVNMSYLEKQILADLIEKQMKIAAKNPLARLF
jgi:hypothetical protein